MKTAVLIPCYNEAKTIEKVIKDFKEHLPHAEIFVYDNNSTDGTYEIAKKAGATVRKEVRQGKGNVVRSMFRDIDSDCYIMADGDNTYPAKFAPVLEKEVLEGRADMAVGDRLSSTYFEMNKRRFHNFGNVLVKDMINFLFHSKINDVMTGARAFSRDFAKSFPVLCKGFEIVSVAKEENLSFGNIPKANADSHHILIRACGKGNPTVSDNEVTVNGKQYFVNS